MRLQEKVFEIQSQDKKIPTSNEVKNLNLVISGIRSDKKFTDLFVDYSLVNTGVKGYSILQVIDAEGNLKINDSQVNVKLFSEKTETEYYVSNVRNPRNIQFSDKDITSDQVEKYVSIIASVLEAAQEETEEKDDTTPETKEESQGGESEEKAQPNDEQPHNQKEEPAPHKETETLSLSDKEEEEEEETTPPHEINDEYNKTKSRLVKDGYSEYAKDNYSFLHHENDKEELPALVKVTSKEKFKPYKLVEIERSETEILYKFMEGDKKRFLLYTINEKIDILSK